MNRYEIRYVIGGGVSIRQQKVVTAKNRPEAYIKSYSTFVEEGYNVTVVKPDNCKYPLCFSKDEIHLINESEIPIKVGSPNGVQIEEVIKQTDD